LELILLHIVDATENSTGFLEGELQSIEARSEELENNSSRLVKGV